MLCSNKDIIECRKGNTIVNMKSIFSLLAKDTTILQI